MASYSRRSLRQRLGTLYLRDTIVGKTTGSWGATASLAFIDSAQADLTLTGEELYLRSVVRGLGASAWIQDARVASFHTGSGAFQTFQTGATTYLPTAGYEVHSLLPPAEKDAVLTEAARHLPVLEWQSQAAIEGNTYSLGPEVLDVVEVAVNPYPVGSSTGYSPQWWRFYPDPHQNTLRLDSALPLSSELAYRAATVQTLGSGEWDSIDLPDDDGLLARAAAEAYWLLERRAPAQEVQVYRQARAEMMQRARLWAQAHPVDAARKLQLDERW